MLFRKWIIVLSCSILLLFSGVSVTSAGPVCINGCKPTISFVAFESLDLAQPNIPITIKGKLKLPACHRHKRKCITPNKSLPAVVILHGSSGIDFRGDFYARALNAAGIATLEINMWEARGISGAADRPALPLLTYPDAFGALKFLAEHPEIDSEHIGVLGFSWGGVITMASATELYSTQFGGGHRFAALVAHYPICYAYNSSIPGSEFFDLTGAPLLIQIGGEDDYDESSAPCFALKASLQPEDQDAIEVVAYERAFHGWDRLEVPFTATDPFSHLGAGGEVDIIPNVRLAYKARKKVVRFFHRKL